MQNLYNLVQREEEREMNALCLEQGVGLIPYSPLARGFLAANRAREGGGATERAQKDAVIKPGQWRESDFAISAKVAEIAKTRGVKPTQVALAWMLSKPVMGAPIIGATQLHYLDEAAAATDLALTADEIKSLEAPYEWRATPGGW
jgi:aryl-alcohol dehydrogenase (NADP+)